MMEFVSAKKLIKSSLAATIANEYELFPLGVGERAFVHQLGLRVRRRTAASFDVDVEYNREGEDNETKLLPPPRRGIPDLIVHQRGYGGPASNLIVCEVKRAWNGNHGARGDIAKVIAAIVRFGFRFGVIIELGPTLYQLQPRWSWWTWEFPGSLMEDSARPLDGIHPHFAAKAQPVFSAKELDTLVMKGRWRVESKDRPGWTSWEAEAQKKT